MKPILAAPAAIAAVLLSGCGDKPANTPGVGAGSSASVGADTRNSESTSRDRKISVDDALSASVQMPAWGLVTEAAQRVLHDNQGVIDAVSALMVSDSIDIAARRATSALELARNKGDVKMIADAEAQLKEAHEAKSKVDGIAAHAECQDDLGRLTTSDTSYDALINNGNCGAMIALASIITQTAEGDVGWPREVALNVNKAYQWASPYAKIAEVANLSGAEILKSVQARALRDPEEAKDRIRAAMVDFVKEGRFKTVWVQTNPAGIFNANWSGSQGYPVHFQIGSTYYGRDQSGWHIIKNGIEWFGGGKVLGRDMTVALQSAVSTGMTKSTGTSSDQGTSTGVDARGEAGVR